jgi:hypothetical protein
VPWLSARLELRLNLLFVKIWILFCFKLIFFSVFGSFWCAGVKNEFKQIKKNIILMYFQGKNILKSNLYYTPKHPLTGGETTSSLKLLCLMKCFLSSLCFWSNSLSTAVEHHCSALWCHRVEQFSILYGVKDTVFIFVSYTCKRHGHTYIL